MIIDWIQKTVTWLTTVAPCYREIIEKLFSSIYDDCSELETELENNFVHFVS